MRRKSRVLVDVIIIGGGHSGLSLCACLGTAGFNVICLERGSVAKAGTKKAMDSRTLALSYRTMQLLQRAKVSEAIQHDACPILDIRVADQDSPHHLDFDHLEVGAGPFGWIIENVLFQKILEKRIHQLRSVSLVAGAVISSIDYGCSAACVTLEDGRVFEAPLIAAADGRASLTRAKAGIAVYGWDYHQTAVVCTIKHTRPHNNIAVEHFHPGGPFATLPMTRQRSSIVWTEKSGTADRLMKMSSEDFTQVLQEKVKDYLGEVEWISARSAFPLTLQHAKKYYGVRLALVGDAAHGIHPIAGQGLNLGMGDVEVLVDELTKASHLGLDLGSPEILRCYEKRRKFDNGNMVFATDILDRLFSTAVPPVQAARRLGLSVVQKAPALRQFFMKTAMGGSTKTG